MNTKQQIKSPSAGLRWSVSNKQVSKLGGKEINRENNEWETKESDRVRRRDERKDKKKKGKDEDREKCKL